MVSQLPIQQFSYISELIMEEYDYLEELDRVPVLRRRRRNHASFIDILSNEEFFSTTRLTKEGAQQLTAMLEEHLDYEDPRG